MSLQVRIESATTAQPVVVKAINYIAATLGIGSFLGLVNLAVGVFSAAWLAVQIYGYLVHELPMKRMRKQLLKHQLDQRHTSGELGRVEVDE